MAIHNEMQLREAVDHIVAAENILRNVEQDQLKLPLHQRALWIARFIVELENSGTLLYNRILRK